jgi:hypothetical protein
LGLQSHISALIFVFGSENTPDLIKVLVKKLPDTVGLQLARFRQRWSHEVQHD